MIEEGANLRIHDPKVSKKQISIDLGIPSEDECIKNPQFNGLFNDMRWNKYSLDNNLFNDVDAVVILTEWDIYSNLDWEKISIKMRSPGWVFDARLIVNEKNVLSSGLNIWRVGDGNLNEK